MHPFKTAALFLAAASLLSCPTPVSERPGRDPSNIGAVGGNCRITLNWTDPPNAFFDRVEITCRSEFGKTVDVAPVKRGVRTVTVSGLENGVEYDFTLKALTTSGAASPGAAVSAVPLPPVVQRLAIAVAPAGSAVSWDVPAAIRDSEEIEKLRVVLFQDGAVLSSHDIGKTEETFSFARPAGSGDVGILVHAVNRADMSPNRVGSALAVKAGASTAQNLLTAIPGPSRVALAWEPTTCFALKQGFIRVSPLLPTRPYFRAPDNDYSLTIDSGFSADQAYSFTLLARNSAGGVRYGLQFAPVNDVRLEAHAPTISNFRAKADKLQKITLNWDSPDANAFQIKLAATRGGGAIPVGDLPSIVDASAGELVYSPADGLQEMAYTFTAVVVDRAGNESPPLVAEAVPSGIVPKVPVNVRVQTSDWTTTITWEDSSENPPGKVIKFNVAVIGDMATNASNAFSVRKELKKATIHGMVPGTKYRVSIAAEDAAGNRSLGKLSDEFMSAGFASTAGSAESFDLGDRYDPGNAQYPDPDMTMLFVPWTAYSDTLFALYQKPALYSSMDFWLAETEVTYAQWRTVCDWATDPARDAEGRRYSFRRRGVCGSKDRWQDPAQWNQPVAGAAWRDYLVFANAMTEYYNYVNGAGLRCVYYQDQGFEKPIRNVETTGNDRTETYNSSPGSNDVPFVREQSDGFRLQHVREWELAFRLDSGGTYRNGLWPWPRQDLLNPVDKDEIAECAKYVCFEENLTYYDGNGAPQILGMGGERDSAESEVVKSHLPTGLGFYDLKGNMWEWCFDSGFREVAGGNVSDPTLRTFVGGSWAIHWHATHTSACHATWVHSYPTNYYVDDNNRLVNRSKESFRKGVRLARTAY